jgi:hypothetical protein
MEHSLIIENELENDSDEDKDTVDLFHVLVICDPCSIKIL